MRFSRQCEEWESAKMKCVVMGFALWREPCWTKNWGIGPNLLSNSSPIKSGIQMAERTIGPSTYLNAER